MNRLDAFFADDRPMYGIVRMNKETWDKWFPQPPVVWTVDSSLNIFNLAFFKGMLWDTRTKSSRKKPSKINGWPLCIDPTLPDGYAVIEGWDGQGARIQL